MLVTLALLFAQFAAGGRLSGVNVSVTISFPTAASSYDAGVSSAISISGAATSDRRLNICTWSNTLGGSGTAVGTTAWSIASVPLTVGTNVITVTCTNIEGTSANRAISILRNSGSPPASLIDAGRKIDWSLAGVIGGIRTHTTICTTLNPGASAAAIDAAIAGCVAGSTVFLNAGTYNLNNAIHLSKSDVTLRGAGANQTLLVFSNHDGCGEICISTFPSDNTYPAASQAQPGGTQAANWVSGYGQDATSIVLNAIGSNGLSVGKYIYLDQGDSSSPTGNFFVCSNTSFPCSLEGPNGPRVINSTNHGKLQVVKITACAPSCTNNATFTISPGLYGTDWGTGADPGAWWPSSFVEFVGLEDLTVDGTNDSGGANNIGFYNAINSWVSGIRSINPTRSHIQYGQAGHCQVQHSYFYGTKNAASQSYGIESYLGSDNLSVNNIFQRVSSPMMTQITTGNVFLYNFDILDFYCSSGSSGCNDNANGTNTMGQTTFMHNAGVEYTLWEGNVTPGYKGDVFHGSGGLQTIFRNRVLGYAPYVGTRGTNAFTLEAYNRAYNILGNVLGTESFTTVYESGSGAKIYDLGSGNTEGAVTVASDALVKTTMFRWGNYDVVNAATRFVTAEVPSGIGNYAQGVPSSQTLPNSLYYTAKPSWFPSAKPWPLIGPDVSGGNVSGYGGHVNTNPAQDCYNAMGGPADGTGAVLSFNRAVCYPLS